MMLLLLEKLYLYGILNNLKYKSLIWETSIISKRIMSWILNADIILKNSNFDFLKEILLSRLLFKQII